MEFQSSHAEYYSTIITAFWLVLYIYMCVYCIYIYYILKHNRDDDDGRLNDDAAATTILCACVCVEWPRGDAAIFVVWLACACVCVCISLSWAQLAGCEIIYRLLFLIIISLNKINNCISSLFLGLFCLMIKKLNGKESVTIMI